MSSTRKTLTSVLVLVAVAVLVAGCISISRTSTSDFDVEERTEHAFNEALKSSSRAAAELSATSRADAGGERVDVLRKHFAVALALVREHHDRVQKALSRGIDFFEGPDRKRRKTLLRLTGAVTPTIHVIEADSAFAIAFPSGEIFMSEEMLLIFDARAEPYDAALLGVLVHELIHVYDGHAANQWATADGRRDLLVDKALGVAANVASILPFLDLEWDMRYGASYKSAPELTRLAENIADFGAIRMLEQNSYDASPYIGLLQRISEVQSVPGKNTKEPFAWLPERLRCIATLSAPATAGDVDALVAGDMKEDGNMAVMSFPSEAFALRDDPVALRKLLDIGPENSDDDIKAALSSSARNFAFVTCVARAAYPKAKVENRILRLREFDAEGFLQFY